MFDRLHSADATATEGGTGLSFLGAFLPSELGEFPRGMDTGPDGKIYIASASSHAILRADPKIGNVETFVPGGSGGLLYPRILRFGRDANNDGYPEVYVTSTLDDLNGVFRFNGLTGEPMPASGQQGAVLVPNGSGGLDYPNGLGFHPTTGDLLVSSSRTDAVLRYDALTGAYLGQFIAAGSGGLDGPQEFTVGPDNRFYVASLVNDQVLRYDLNGNFVNVFVTQGSGGLDSPYGIAFGPDGDLFVASLGSNPAVLRYSGTTGAFKETVAKIADSNGAWDPHSLLFDARGNLYVSRAQGGKSVLRYGPSAQAAVAVTLSKPVGGEVVFDAETVDGTATLSGNDYPYQALNQTQRVRLVPGQTSAVVLIDTLDDALEEPNETFSLQVTLVQGAVLGKGSAVITILDDDSIAPPQIVTFTDSPDPVKQGQTITLTATVDGVADRVAFYRDKDGDGAIDADEWLGTDTNGGDGWSLTVSIPSNFPTGTYTYFAQAEGPTGLLSGVVATTNTVQSAKGKGTKTASAGSLAVSSTSSSSDTTSRPSDGSAGSSGQDEVDAYDSRPLWRRHSAVERLSYSSTDLANVVGTRKELLAERDPLLGWTVPFDLEDDLLDVLARGR